MTGTTPTDPAHDFGETPAIHYEDLHNGAHRPASVDVSAQWTIEAVDGTRDYRLKMLMVRGTNDVEDLWVVRLESDGTSTEVLHLTGPGAARFVALIRNNAFAPVDGSPVARPKMLPDAVALSAAYQHDPSVLRRLVEHDATAEDIVATAHRKQVVTEFRRMIEDDDHFDALVEARSSTSKEGVWQDFFEANPWLLGLGLSSQLLVGWDEKKLERTVVGADIAGPGKRADAVLTSAGVIGLLALAEIKHHRTDLLATRAYRSGCWAPSDELAGAVAQSQGTVQLALERLGPTLETKDAGGFTLPAETAYTYRPGSFVVIGQLSEFVHPATGGHNQEKIRSFELYRRNLHEPVVLTFDELLARAEALIATQA